MEIKIINTNVKTRDELFKEICKVGFEEGFITNQDKVFDVLVKREEQGTTGFTGGIAIPHARINEITKTVILIARNKEGINWPSLDGKLTNTAISLLVVGGNLANDAHLELLAKVAKSLIDENKKQLYVNGSIGDIKNIL